MKKLLILMILMILALPMVLANFYTDTSRNYFTQKCYSGGTGDCYSEGGYWLNNYEDTWIEKLYNINYPKNNDSRVEYNSTDWDSCNLVLGGSEFRGLPFNYQDPYINYTIASFIRIRNYGNNSYIEQINSNCQIWDSYPTGENTSIVSQLGMINKGNSQGLLPVFAFAYNNTNNGNVYMRVYQIDNSIGNPNLLEWLPRDFVDYQDYFIGDWEEFGDYDNNLGVAGGSLYSEDNNPNPEERVFGMFSNNFKELFILYGDYTYPYFSHSEIIDVPDYYSNSTNHQLFFDDWDADGNNEFILIGASGKLTPVRTHFNLNRIQPLTTPPYYYKYNEINFTPSYLSYPKKGQLNYYGDGHISICQIGYYDSPLEACVSGRNAGDSPRLYSAVIDNSFTTEIFSESDGTYTANLNSPMFSLNKDLRGQHLSENLICLGYGIGAGILSKIECKDINGVLQETIYPNNVGSNFFKSSIIIGELDGNYSSPEIIYSSGEIESIRWNATAYDLPDWESTFDWTYNGSLWLQDISGDNRNELIYMDDNFFRVYSMNRTPSTFLTYQEVLIASSTTTTVSGTTTTTIQNYDPKVPVIYTQINNNASLLFGLFLILGLAIFAVVMTKSTVIGIIGAIIGTVLAVSIGLIDGGVLVIIIISLTVLMILSFTLLKPGN